MQQCRRSRHCVAPGRLSISVLLFALVAGPAFGQETHGSEATDHSHGLHFSHPLFTESVSPDTKVRLITGREWEADGNTWEFGLEAEYAFHRSFSIELGIPYGVVQPEGASRRSRVGNMEVLLKFANYAFEEDGLLLGYGIEFGLPTGDQNVGIGNDHLWEIGPVFNIGYKRGAIELVGCSIFEIPFHQESGEDVETELLYDGSALVHLSSRIQAVVELNGSTVLSGEESGATLLRASPGIKVTPSKEIPLWVGLGMGVPLTDSELDAVGQVTLFWHF